MRIRLFRLVISTALIVPCMLGAQSQDNTNAWTIAAGVGAGIANVPSSPTPVYFDASQLTARLAIQRTIGGGLSGGVAVLATVGTQGSDCVLGPCAPPFVYHAAKATLTYMGGNTIQRWRPHLSLGVGVARLPEQWAELPGTRTPVSSTLLLSGAVDVPVLVRARSALLVGWEGSVLPNAPGGRVVLNTLVLTVRHNPF